jgi:hypothetical protein
MMLEDADLAALAGLSSETLQNEDEFLRQMDSNMRLLNDYMQQNDVDASLTDLIRKAQEAIPDEVEI